MATEAGGEEAREACVEAGGIVLTEAADNAAAHHEVEGCLSRRACWGDTGVVSLCKLLGRCRWASLCSALH